MKFYNDPSLKCVEASVVYVAEMVSKAYNTRRKPSQRLQAIPRKYYFILELFGIVISHRYFCSLHWLVWIWYTEDLFPKLENKVADR